MEPSAKENEDCKVSRSWMKDENSWKAIKGVLTAVNARTKTLKEENAMLKEQLWLVMALNANLERKEEERLREATARKEAARVEEEITKVGVDRI